MIRAMLLTGSRANANGAVDAFLDDDGQRLFRGGRRFMIIHTKVACCNSQLT
jgi:hypothetical protein